MCLYLLCSGYIFASHLFQLLMLINAQEIGVGRALFYSGANWVKLHVVVVLISILVGETSFNACKLGVPFVRRGHVASYKVSVRSKDTYCT